MPLYSFVLPNENFERNFFVHAVIHDFQLADLQDVSSNSIKTAVASLQGIAEPLAEEERLVALAAVRLTR